MKSVGSIIRAFTNSVCAKCNQRTLSMALFQWFLTIPMLTITQTTVRIMRNAIVHDLMLVAMFSTGDLGDQGMLSAQSPCGSLWLHCNPVLMSVPRSPPLG